MNNNYYLDLVTMDIIKYQGVSIYPISFKEIKETIGYEVFSQCMFPFCITKDYIEYVNNCELDNTFNLFEEIILKDKDMVKLVSIILSIFCKPEHIYADDKGIMLCDDKDNVMFVLNRDNFEEFSEIILKLNGKSKLKVEKPPKNMSNRQRDVWEKLQAGRKREEKKNEVHFYDILNVCEFAGQYRIPISEIESWTIWKILNCYNAKIGLKSYDDSLAIGLVAHDLKDIQGNNHWLKKLMIRD